MSTSAAQCNDATWHLDTPRRDVQPSRAGHADEHPPLPRSEEAQDRCVLLPMFASITTDQLFEVAQGCEVCRL
jgi:hypothetical protein